MIRDTTIQHAEAIRAEVLAQRHITLAELTSKRRHPRIVAARREVIWRVRNEANVTLKEAAELVGCADHTTAMHHYERAKALAVPQDWGADE